MSLISYNLPSLATILRYLRRPEEQTSAQRDGEDRTHVATCRGGNHVSSKSIEDSFQKRRMKADTANEMWLVDNVSRCAVLISSAIGRVMPYCADHDFEQLERYPRDGVVKEDTLRGPDYVQSLAKDELVR